MLNMAQSVEICLIGTGLAMDAFAVSVANGATARRMKLRHAMRMAAFFGAFQAIMPLLGWSAGQVFRRYIRDVDHWVAFILLAVVGGKMIYEARKLDGDGATADPLNVYVLFALAVATSIDALAVGVTFSLLAVDVWHAAGIIGAVTFLLSFLGSQAGKSFGHLLERRLEVIGGVILIGMGLKIFIHHQFFGG